MNGMPTKLPLCISTGILSGKVKKRLYGIDDLGMGVSIYFKLLKAIILFFTFAILAMSPLLYIYSCGEKYDSSFSNLSYLTLGNIGQR